MIRAQQAAGSLYVASAVLSLLLFGEIMYLQVALAFALFWVDDPVKSSILRLVILCWVLFAVAVVVISAVDSGVWLTLVPMILFAGSIAALMLENLEQRSIIFITGVGSVGILLSLFI